MSKKDFFKWPLLKAYSKMQNIIFPNVVFTNIILLFLDAFSVKKNRKKNEILNESTYIIDIVTFFLESVKKTLYLNFQANVE